MRLLPNDPFSAPEGDCDACGHPPHPDRECRHHPSFDPCPGFRTEPIPADVAAARLAEIMNQPWRQNSAKFFAKDFTYLKEER